MATYREIKGLTFPYLSADLPSASADTQEGGVWYNSGTGKLRGFLSYDTWATTSPVNTGRNASVAGGTQTAGLVAMGTPFLNSTEEYNGSGWSSGGNINTAREEGGSGGSVHTQTAAIIFAGKTPPSTAVDLHEQYDGSSWTAETAINTARRSQLGGAGTTTACVAFGGNNPDPVGDQTESWNGTAWTEVADMNEPVSVGGGSAGTSSASALCAGGYGPPGLPQGRMATVEEWDNTSWTETADLNTARYILAGAGTTTAAVYFGGNSTSPAKVGVTESFDGTSWTETADLPAATQSHSGTGSLSAALMISGNGASPAGTVCAEFQKSILTYTPAARASGGALNTTRNNMASAGTQTAALAISGESGTNTVNVEEYDGSSWTEIANVNTAMRSVRGFGTTTAALKTGGFPGYVDTTETWNGSSWTEVGDLNQGRAGHAACGTTTAGLAFGGETPSSIALTEKWDGSSWTEVGDLNTAREELMGCGIQTAALAAGTVTAPRLFVETYDGSSWTNANDLITATGQGLVAGVQSSALSFGGDTPASPGVTAITQLWDGTNWSTAPSMPAAKYKLGGAGASNTSSLSFGGLNASDANQTTTDEFTGVTTAAEAADIDFD